MCNFITEQTAAHSGTSFRKWLTTLIGDCKGAGGRFKLIGAFQSEKILLYHHLAKVSYVILHFISKYYFSAAAYSANAFKGWLCTLISDEGGRGTV